MFLKSVELEGYKSFAENTRVTFTDGIVAIIGPNSCGKHNFIEAITWALGISDDARDSADDVIFRGTEQYAKSTCAKVTLTLADETKITRSLSRTGEDNFFINEKASTKSEVHSLLENAGLPSGECIVITQDFVQEFAQANYDKKLSRTEKMITALSSILSNDKKLSPIYFLDEVDAFFDDKNCQRFVDILEKIEEKSQIIVITHNKKVITASSQMIGVSLDNAGVSKAVSLELNNGMF